MLLVWGALALAGAPLLSADISTPQPEEMIQRYRETADGAYLDKAEGLLKPILAADPANAKARRLQLELAMFRHEFPSVVLQATALLESSRADRALLALLGDALMERGEYDKAGVAYERFAALRPNQEGFNRLAWHRWVTGRKDEALAWMGHAVAAKAPVAEHQAWCLTEFADMLRKAGRTAAAEAALAEAGKLFPHSHRARAIQARIATAKGDRAAAAKLWREAIAILPLAEYAAELALTVDPRDSEREWAFAMKIQDLARARGEKANRLLAVLLADAGRDLNRALELAEAEFEVRDDVYSYDAKAWVLFKMGRVEEARAAMKKALRYNTPEPQFADHARRILGGS